MPGKASSPFSSSYDGVSGRASLPAYDLITKIKSVR